MEFTQEQEELETTLPPLPIGEEEEVYVEPVTLEFEGQAAADLRTRAGQSAMDLNQYVRSAVALESFLRYQTSSGNKLLLQDGDTYRNIVFQ
jgi:hypothetical protein